MSLVQHLGENVMDKLLQADISYKEKLLLLIAWFNASTEKNESSASFEEAVGRLIGHFDCTKVHNKPTVPTRHPLY